MGMGIICMYQIGISGGTPVETMDFHTNTAYPTNDLQNARGFATHTQWARWLWHKLLSDRCFKVVKIRSTCSGWLGNIFNELLKWFKLRMVNASPHDFLSCELHDTCVGYCTTLVCLY